MDTDELERLTYQHFPRPFLRDLLRAVFVGRRDAWAECARELPPPEAENVRGYQARARIEAMMRDVAARHVAIAADVVKQDGQPWNHTELRSGPLILTAASVGTPLAMVREAEYRANLALSNQARFDFANEPTLADAPLYVLLLRSGSHWITKEHRRDYGHLPGSAYLVYPASDFKSYHHSINLFDVFPQVVKANTPAEWDEIALIRYVERSRRVG